MDQCTRNDNLIVYVVLGRDEHMMNDRVAKVLQLRRFFRKMVLVARGPGEKDDEKLIIRALPNPTEILRRVGLRKIRNWIDRVFYFPNPHVLYSVCAKRRLGREVAKDLATGRDVCVVTCVPNHENASIGLYIKRRHPEIRWVVDWQDLWSYDENYFKLALPIYQRRLKAKEAEILATADMNVTTNTCAMSVLHEVYGVPPSKLRSINHHFHRADFDNGGALADQFPKGIAIKQTDAIKIGFLGCLFKPPRVPGLELVETFKTLRSSGINVQLHLHGRLPLDIAPLAESLRESALVLQGEVSHRQSVSVLSKYDYLLVLLADLPNSKAVMSIKLTQYLLTQRPIIAIVPEPSAIADIVKSCGAGYVIPSSADWAWELTRIMRGHPEAPLARDEDAIERFSWDHISREWADVIDVT